MGHLGFRAPVNGKEDTGASLQVKELQMRKFTTVTKESNCKRIRQDYRAAEILQVDR